jgi:hypothetical protein
VSRVGSSDVGRDFPTMRHHQPYEAYRYDGHASDVVVVHMSIAVALGSQIQMCALNRDGGDLVRGTLELGYEANHQSILTSWHAQEQIVKRV